MPNFYSWFRKKSFFAVSQPLYIRISPSTLAACLIVFVASFSILMFVHTAEAQDEDLLDEGIQKVQEEINKKFESLRKEIEGTLDGSRPPGKPGELIDKAKEAKKLIDKIVDSTDSEWESDKIKVLGDLLKKLGEEVGNRGPQFEPVGKMITTMGEATHGMGESLEGIDGLQKEKRKAIDRGDLAPEAFEEEQQAQRVAARARYLEAVREAAEERDWLIAEEKRKERIECPEKCTEAYSDWKVAFEKLIDERIALKASKKQYENAEEYRTTAEGVRLQTEEQLRIAKIDGNTYGIMEAENTLRSFSLERVKERMEKATKELRAAQAAYDKAKAVEEKAWAAYRDCVKKCNAGTTEEETLGFEDKADSAKDDEISDETDGPGQPAGEDTGTRDGDRWLGSWKTVSRVPNSEQEWINTIIVSRCGDDFLINNSPAIEIVSISNTHLEYRWHDPLNAMGILRLSADGSISGEWTQSTAEPNYQFGTSIGSRVSHLEPDLDCN